MSPNIAGSFVQPQPSESVESILIRLCRASGLSSPEALVQETLPACQFYQFRHRSAKAAAAISHIFSIPFVDVVRRHTLLPLILSLNYYGESCHAFNFGKSGSSRVQSETLRVCPECTREDLQWHGYSFYRRDHQIIGVNVCHKHGEPLLKLKKGAERYLPSDAEFKDFIEGPCPSNDLCPLSYKYRELVVGLLEREKPISSVQLGNSLRGLVQSAPQDVSIYQTAIEKLIEMRSIEDGNFINDLVTHTSKVLSPQPIKKLRFAFYGGELNPLIYALISLLVTDSVPEAMNVLLGKRVVSAQARKTSISSEKLVDAYVRCGGSFGAVRSEVGMDRSSIRVRFLQIGLPNLGRKGVKLGAVLQPLSDGSSVEEAAVAAGLKPGDLQRVVVGLALNRIGVVNAPPTRG